MLEGNSIRRPKAAPCPTRTMPFRNSSCGLPQRLRIAPTPASLIHLFCHATREFFQVSGVYFWRRHAGDELVGEQADGKMAERFLGLRLLPQQSAVTADAVRSRRTIFVNQLSSQVRLPALASSRPVL